MLYRDTSQGVKAAAGIYTHAIMFPNQLTRSKLMLNSRAAGEIVLNKIAPMGARGRTWVCNRTEPGPSQTTDEVQNALTSGRDMVKGI